MKGFRDDADRQDAEFARGPRNDGGSAGAGAAAHASRDEHHVRARNAHPDFVDRLFGGGLADFRFRASAEALGQVRAELDGPVRARHGKGLRVGVRDHELDAFEARRDHVVDRVAASPADADNNDARL